MLQKAAAMVAWPDGYFWVSLSPYLSRIDSPVFSFAQVHSNEALWSQLKDYYQIQRRVGLLFWWSAHSWEVQLFCVSIDWPFLLLTSGFTWLSPLYLSSPQGTPCHLWPVSSRASGTKVQILFPSRIGQPEDCAGLVSFLCSADGSYINGESIAVAGFSSRL